MRFVGFWAVLGFVSAAACAPSPIIGGGGSDSGGVQVDAAEERESIDAALVGFPIGAPCERAQQCRDELICDPATDTCAEPLSCSEHDECGAGAHCNDQGVCEQSVANSPCGRDLHCELGDVCIGGYCGCRGAVFQAEPVEVNMLVVLDRSGSMWQEINGEPKWYIALDAIDGLLEQFGARANFGMGVFPHSEIATEDACHPNGETLPQCNLEEACYEGNTLVDVADGTEGPIRDALGATLPACCTPTGATLETYLGYPQLSDPDAENYILLVADGKEKCGGDAPAAAAALRAQEGNVRTFAVGFGSAIDPDELTAIAEQGGTARDGELKYYQADSAQELNDAFADIGGKALVCSYTLDGVPPNPDELHAYFDGEPVPRDPSRQNGWDYEPSDNTIDFYGPACDALQNGEVEDLSILQTCELIED